jgi:hypothetical protein
MALLRDTPLDFKLHATTHDLVVERGDVLLTSDTDGVKQDVKIAVQMIAGEWFYNLDEGIAFFKRVGIDPSRVILGSKFNKQRVVSEFNRAILSVEGVASITSILVEFDVPTRTVSVRYEVKTVFGDSSADSLSVGGSNA